ncbi:hypothetical protein LR48_Vigan10g072400 [Vigna angularis]|uniref:Uncharacterized protein n=1 Tax=Phaseolus angularis TaxID=3914 RepID=A0A0L9VIT7_PHAAN|nr:hypothetical protein LR48_Vigan10g072400 [Vigna angularis]
MTSSSGKRLKTMATKRKEKEPEQPHYSRFLSRKHEKHFKGKLATYPAPANIAWPEEPVQGGGAEAAEASVREMEEDEADDDDAFEDDEDEEEEEDTEDSSD